MSDNNNHTMDIIFQRLNSFELEFREWKGTMDHKTQTLEEIARNHEAGLNDAKKEAHKLNIKIGEAKEEILAKMSTRLGIMLAIVTAVISAIVAFT